MAEIVVKLVNGELAGKTAQEIKKEVSAAALALNKAKIGTEEWVKANKRMDEVKQTQSDLKKQIEGTTGASDMLKKAWNNLPGAGFFNQIAGSFGMLKGGVGGLISQFGLLKTAIIGTGIGALVIVLTAVVTWFTKTERGGDMLAKIMAAIGAVVSVLTDRLSKLVDALIAFATGNWSEAAKLFGETTKGVTDELIAEAKAAWDLADALDQLEELEGKLILIRSRSREQISELRKLSKDEALSIGERSAAIQKAIEITKALTDQELKAKEGRVLQALQVKDLTDLANRYGVSLQELLDRGEEIISVDNLGLGESTQEDLNKAFEALAAYNEELTKGNDEQRTLMMDLNKLNRKERAADTKDIKDNLKAEQDALKEQQAALDNIRKLEQEKKLKSIEDDRLREIEKLAQDTEAKITALQGSEAQIFEQIKLIRELQGQELESIEAKYEAERVAKHQAYLDQLNADSEKWAEEQIKIDQDKANFAVAMDQVRRDSAADLTTFLADAIGKQIGDEKAAKKIKKISGLVDIGINLFKEKASNAATSAANPLNAVTFGAAGAAQLITLNTASNIRAAIGAARILAFEKGGMIGGRRHSNGGTLIEAEQGEFMFSRKAVAGIGIGALSAMNNHYTKFANGGSVPMPSSPYRDRAPVASGRAGSSAGGDALGINELRSDLRAYTSAINDRIDRIQVVNNLQDTQKGLTTLNQLKNEADV